LRRTRSPKRGGYLELFRELVRFPAFIENPNLVLEALLVDVEEWRCTDGKGSWRRAGNSIRDTRLLGVCASRRFRRVGDLAALIPARIGPEFTNAALAKACGIHLSLAGKTTYSLRRMGALEVGGMDGRAQVFRRKPLE
jgi:hypothetical protein